MSESSCEKIDLKIDTDVVGFLVTSFVQTNLSPCALITFNAAIDSGKSIEVALYEAVLNHTIEYALIEEINKQPIEAEWPFPLP